MSAPVSSIRNLGPTSDASYARAGITSAQVLRDIGPDAAYARLLAHGSRPHFIGYYAMVMGLQGRPWNDCKGAEKPPCAPALMRLSMPPWPMTVNRSGFTGDHQLK
tara:strand:- start:4 stop:321 length:318 start_codon:yes stop_codon:yes gene_type:complete